VRTRRFARGSKSRNLISQNKQKHQSPRTRMRLERNVRLSLIETCTSTVCISQKVVIKVFCKNQSPHKSVNQSFILVIIKDKLTDLCENGLLQNDFIHTFCEVKPDSRYPQPETLHPTTYARHPNPHTQNPDPQPLALHPAPHPSIHKFFTTHPSYPSPFTLHPTPYTLHSASYTLHPTPYTLHPKP